MRQPPRPFPPRSFGRRIGQEPLRRGHHEAAGEIDDDAAQAKAEAAQTGAAYQIGHETHQRPFLATRSTALAEGRGYPSDAIVPTSTLYTGRSARLSERVPGRALREFEITKIGSEPQPETGTDRHHDDIVARQRRHAQTADEIS